MLEGSLRCIGRPILADERVLSGNSPRARRKRIVPAFDRIVIPRARRVRVEARAAGRRYDFTLTSRQAELRPDGRRERLKLAVAFSIRHSYDAPREVSPTARLIGMGAHTPAVLFVVEADANGDTLGPCAEDGPVEGVPVE